MLTVLLQRYQLVDDRLASAIRCAESIESVRALDGELNGILKEIREFQATTAKELELLLRFHLNRIRAHVAGGGVRFDLAAIEQIAMKAIDSSIYREQQRMRG